MTPETWLRIISLIIDLIKTAIPYIAVFFILWYFRKEMKALLTKGQVKISAPGFSLETTQQSKEISKEEKKEIATINKELTKEKKPLDEKIVAIQNTTPEDNQALFLSYHFEKTYRLIFPTQMVILVSAYNHGGTFSEALAQSLFTRTVWFRTFGLSYEQFISFLINAGLMMKTSSLLKLTPLGILFLEYLNTNNIPNKLPPADQVERG